MLKGSVRIEKFVFVLLLICSALLITAGLFERIELVEQNSENVLLMEELDELRQENRRLLIARESAFSLTETENYAKTVLGMAKPNIGQITEINNSFPDEEANGDKN